MNKFVKIALNHSVNTAAIKAVKYYEVFSTVKVDLDGAPADAVSLTVNTVTLPTPEGGTRLATVEQTFRTKAGRNRVVAVACEDGKEPVGCLRIEMMDGEVHLVPAYGGYNDIASKLLAVFELDY